MFPWLWFWAPQVHYPWSGDVAQRIDPDTNWFFGTIAAPAGNGRIEQKAFKLASYGKQLGLITEIVLAMSSELELKNAKARESLVRLRRLAEEIEDLKDTEYRELAQSLAQQMQQLKSRRPREFERLRALMAEAPPALPAG